MRARPDAVLVACLVRTCAALCLVGVLVIMYAPRVTS